MPASGIDPWIQTIQLLSPGSQLPDVDDQRTFTARRRASSGCKSAFSADPSHHQVVSLIERTTSSTATFAWRDPTSCSYGEQIWRAARAKVSGICAISGARIKRGDLIFHPQRSKLAPANAGAMILASALNDVEPLQSAMAGVVE
jgi:hypothetical protein